MKKLFFLSGLLLMASMLFAQSQEQIVDGGFETNWVQKNSSRGPYWDFNVNSTDMLRTLNSLYSLEVQVMETKLTSFREINPYAGQYALRMETVKLANTLLVPGAFGTISPDFVDEYLDPNGDHSIGLLAEFYSKPKRLTGYYKYAPVNNDSACIELELFDYPTRIASALWKEKNAVSEWTKFDIPINYTSEDRAVSDIKLIFASSGGYNFDQLDECRGQVGSKFWLDNIAFEYHDVGLREPLMERIYSKASPNPANTIVTISFDKTIDAKLVIYNILGAEVATQPISGNTVEANVSHLASGSYLYRVIEGNIIRASGKFIVE